jgi:hypothetical protein
VTERASRVIFLLSPRFSLASPAGTAPTIGDLLLKAQSPAGEITPQKLNLQSLAAVEVCSLCSQPCNQQDVCANQPVGKWYDWQS